MGRKINSVSITDQCCKFRKWLNFNSRVLVFLTPWTGCNSPCLRIHWGIQNPPKQGEILRLHNKGSAVVYATVVVQDRKYIRFNYAKIEEFIKKGTCEFAQESDVSSFQDILLGIRE